ncbi:helix-turn-helix transcriptional regulator [Paenibacillus polymyxa]|uniref:helix-turn-helix domain-containing protein n=1 Tax=Paenibacillus polymyxa TaxID=1406 RepID=UPI002AB4C870|nr:helix-turn-helix transcriptional regulator [Paenibacillus polymyxa]MDY8021280.1 helix-turn-helix transcriptional regulator [Paenibacillus polymyxa]
MIRIKVAELLGKNKMTRKDLAERTGIRPATIGMMYDETIKRIEIEYLERVCIALDCSISDLIEIIPDSDRDKS